MKSKNKRLIGILIAIAILLFIPFIAMQFTAQVKWSLMDFLLVGILLLVTGLACEFVLRKVKSLKYRVAICLIILILFVVIWLELAVGVFGSPFGGN